MDLSERRDGRRRHPWEVARSRFFRRIAADHVDVGAVRRVLDVGAGDGWFASQLLGDLADGATVTCWDANYSVEELQDDGLHGIVRTAVRPAGTFELVVALDVLEHVPDDEAFLAEEIVPAIAPGGTALISAPAHRWLFSDHDRALQHVRRYPPAELRALVGRHLEVITWGSLFSTLVAPRAVGVLTERLGRSSAANGIGGWHRGRVVTGAATVVLGADAAINRSLSRGGVPVPGLSAWVVATRTGGGAG